MQAGQAVILLTSASFFFPLSLSASLLKVVDIDGVVDIGSDSMKPAVTPCGRTVVSVSTSISLPATSGSSTESMASATPKNVSSILSGRKRQAVQAAHLHVFRRATHRSHGQYFILEVYSYFCSRLRCSSQ